MKDVIYSVYGREIARALLEVSQENSFMKIEGFVVNRKLPEAIVLLRTIISMDDMLKIILLQKQSKMLTGVS